MKRRKPRVPELMGAAEACDALGVKSGNLGKVKGLPKPVQTLRATAVWRASDIRALVRARARDVARREAAQNG